MEGTAKSPQAGSSVRRAQIAAAYAERVSALSFWDAKKRASESGATLISAKRMVNLFKVASTLSTSDSTLLKEFEGGLRVSSPNFSWFFDGVSRKDFAPLISAASPAWVDALLLRGPFPEQTSTFGTDDGKVVLELPKGFVGLREVMLFDSGSFTDEREEGRKMVRVSEDAKPVFLGERYGSSTLYLDEKGDFTHSSQHSRRKTDPLVAVFIHTHAEKASRLVCAISSLPSEGGVRGSTPFIIRLSTLSEHERMGAILEFP
ncbi:MAG: hypothetical protein QXH30_01910 [Candidatus Bilamarchaeaceae archaeon]